MKASNVKFVFIRDKESFRQFLKTRFDPSEKIIASSENVEIINSLKKISWVDSVVYLESGTSAFSVMEDVQRLRNIINDRLRQILPEIPSYLTEFCRFTEGGRTTQKILDALIIFESIINLKKDFSFSSLVLMSHAVENWEDDVIMLAAKHLGVATKLIAPLHVRFVRRLHCLSFTRVILGKNRHFNVPSRLIYLALKSQLLIRLISAKFVAKSVPDRIGKTILFLLGCPSEKHFVNQYVVAKEFAQTSSGNQPFMLCWRAEASRKRFIASGFKADNLERWIPLSSAFKLFKKHKKLASRVQSSINDLINDTKLSFRSFHIGAALADPIIFFVNNDLLLRLFIDFGAQNFVSTFSPIAMKIWGGGGIDLGTIFMEKINESDKIDRTKFVSFDFPLGHPFPIHFGETKPGLVDLYFVPGENIKAHFERALPGTDVIVTGFVRETVLSEYEGISKEEARSKLNITGHETILLYASTDPVRGFISQCENNKIVDLLVKFAISHPNTLLLIKPHPGEDEEILYSISKENGNPRNIQILNKMKNPYLCIIASDVIALKFSTMGIEAMKLNRPVLSLSLDGERRLDAIYEDGVERATTEEECRRLLDSIFRSRESLASWTEHRLEIQRHYLPKKVLSTIEPPEKNIVRHVVQNLTASASEQAAAIS